VSFITSLETLGKLEEMIYVLAADQTHGMEMGQKEVSMTEKEHQIDIPLLEHFD
jgi:hypothetical protein